MIYSFQNLRETPTALKDMKGDIKMTSYEIYRDDPTELAISAIIEGFKIPFNSLVNVMDIYHLIEANGLEHEYELFNGCLYMDGQNIGRVGPIEYHPWAFEPESYAERMIWIEQSKYMPD